MLQGDLVASYFTKSWTWTPNLTFLGLNTATKRPHARCWFTLAMDADALIRYAQLIQICTIKCFTTFMQYSLVKRSTCHMGRRNLRRECQGQSLLDLIDRLVLGTKPLVHDGVT
jgi:hypothetical protein